MGGELETLSTASSMGRAPSSAPGGRRQLLCIVHPFDPRGNKIGGIETHVRLLLRRAPQELDVLLVGVDEAGDLTLGQAIDLTADGRAFRFLPVTRYSDAWVAAMPRTIANAMTFRFALGLLRYYRSIATALRGKSVSIEIERFEFASLLWPLRKPIVQLIHGDGRRDQPMDSIIGQHWALHRFGRAVALRLASVVVCVTPEIKADVETSRAARRKAVTFMPVPVDEAVFSLAPLEMKDGVLRVVFAGRLDRFKDPALMFRAVALAHQQLAGALEFHYVGASDPERYPAFAAIRDFAVLHGYRTQKELADIVGRCHCGILTSFFEGMPCFLLETLAVGRPFVAVRLAQYDLVLEEAVNARLIGRAGNADDQSVAVAEALVRLRTDIEEGRIDPHAVREKALPYGADRLLARHFSLHGTLAAGLR